MKPQNLLAAFGINAAESRGARMWVRLTWQLWAGKTLKEVMQEIFSEEELLPHKTYAMMKRALAPIFNASEEHLKELGLQRPETVTELALAVAATIDSKEDRALELYKARQQAAKSDENTAPVPRQLTL